MTSAAPLRSWHVHKLGGTSLGTPDCYVRVKDVVSLPPPSSSSPASVAIVVSAMAGITDSLLKCISLAKQQDETYKQLVETIRSKVHSFRQTLLDPTARELSKTYEQVIDRDIQAVHDILKAVWLTRCCSLEMEELVAGYGELWSAQLAQNVLLTQGHNVCWLDARQVLFVSRGEVGPLVDWERSRNAALKWVEENMDQNEKGSGRCSVVVVTGFIASTPEGLATTLKRNGSDYSAAIFAALLKAEQVTIWKEVDGVYTADPRKVKDAVHLSEISYAEAMELAYFGAKILHPHTMAPAIEHQIPIMLKNVFHPERPGTVIKAHVQDVRTEMQVVRGFSSVPNVALINVEGTGMMGVPGIASKLFGSLKEIAVSVVLISQASSEHSICLAVPDDQGQRACEHIRKTFFMEINHYRYIQKVDLIPQCSILAAVGDQMAHTPGLAAKFMSALGNRDINVRAIAQGSSERNISVVISEPDTTRALQAVHSAFFRPYDPLVLSVGVIGPGLVGSTLLAQLRRAKMIPKNVSKFVFRVRGICDSKTMLIDTDTEGEGVSLRDWKEQLGSQGRPHGGDLDMFVEAIQKGYPRHAIIVDCTSSEAVARLYPKWLERGVHVVAPNKKAFSGPLQLYHDIKKAMQMSGRHCLYETTVGAGLPILHMMQELRATGDRVVQIEGILSGTLSFIFNTFSPKPSGSQSPPPLFSATVLDARARGYTEPDPRDDLNGRDFARKVLILARETGIDLNMEDIKVQSLVAEEDAASDVDTFLSGLPKHDARWQQEAQAALAEGMVLRYVGVVQISLDGQGASSPLLSSAAVPRAVASVGIRKYPFNHPFANLGGCDNVLALQSDRYSGQPMIVQGPGAGAEVTAGGIFGDMFRIANYMS